MTEPISVLARAGHPIFSGPVTVEELRRYDLVLPTITQRVGQELEHMLSLLGIDPVTFLRSSSYSLIREMLHGTDVLSVMPRLMMVGDLLRGTLRVVPLPIPAPDRPAGVILPRGRALPSAGLAFVACLRAYVAEITQRGIALSITNGNSEAGRNDRTRPIRESRADDDEPANGHTKGRSAPMHRANWVTIASLPLCFVGIGMRTGFQPRARWQLSTRAGSRRYDRRAASGGARIAPRLVFRSHAG